jgi:hypothetical protein
MTTMSLYAMSVINSFGHPSVGELEMFEDVIECPEVVGKVVKYLKLYRSDPDTAELQIDFEDGTSFSCILESKPSVKATSFEPASVPQQCGATTSDNWHYSFSEYRVSLKVIGRADRVILALHHADTPGQRRCKVDQILPILRSDKPSVRLPFRIGYFSTRGPSIGRSNPTRKETVHRAVRAFAPALVALSFATAAHAQGTMDFTGAKTLMGTFKEKAKKLGKPTTAVAAKTKKAA